MTDDQRTQIQTGIDELDVGENAKLADLMGNAWDAVGDDTAKRQLGREFRQKVLDGRFPNVRFLQTDGANHAIYIRVR